MRRLCVVLLACSGFGAEPAIDFVHISDVHLVEKAGVRTELAEKRAHPGSAGETLRATLAQVAKGPAPAFVMLTGDIVDAWCFDGAAGESVYGQVRLFQSVYNDSRVPLFMALGNHDVHCYRYQPGKPGPASDLSAAAQARADWSKAFPCFRDGTYYSIRKQAGRTTYRLLVLDNGDAGKDERYTEAQLRWFREQLATSGRDVLIVVMHVPFVDRDFFAQLKAGISGNPRVRLALAGHQHVDRVEEIDVGGRTLVEALAPALRAGPTNWRRIRLLEDRIEVYAVGDPGKVVRTISAR